MSYESYKWKGGDLITVNQMNRIEQGVLEMNEAYVPTVWQTGDTVTAEKLNKIEQGIAEGGGLVYPTFTVDGQGNVSCDMTYTEAKASYVASVDSIDFAPVALVRILNDTQALMWGVDALGTGEQLSAFADVPDTVTEGLAILLIGNGAPEALYADDGNFYLPKQD